MVSVSNIKQYVKIDSIDMAFVIVILGILLGTFVKYACFISILACFFIKDEKDEN
jgi:hypothetical protein